jgi:hypothetical protein
MAITVAMRTQVSQLYVSLFGRAPDGEGLQSAHTMLIPTPGDSMRQSERNTCIVHRGRTRLAGRPRAYNASPRRRAARERSCGASTSRV